MGKLGFGAYRVSHQSDSHKEALNLAINLNLTLIDTSSNYTGGESETLIGEVSVDSTVKVISKCGYIQSEKIEKVQNYQEVNKISDHLYHCIHPDFIEDELNESLRRLKKDKIEAYLLHNPEYYLKTENSNKDEFYKRIEKALILLQKKCEQGKIKYFGISSNTFISPREDHESLDILEVLKIVDRNSLSRFKYIQFPLNLLELDALQRQFNGKTIIEVAKENDLRTISNRPLNAFTSQGFVRLAEYDFDKSLNENKAKKIFVDLNKSLKLKWNEQRDDDLDELEELALFKQISSIWYKQKSIDAVEQIFYGHYFKLLTNIWGRSLGPKESEPFYKLFEYAIEFAKKNMTELAQEFKREAKNQLIEDSDRPLQNLAIEKYLDLGIDYVLVGMRSKKYVQEMENYF